MAAVMSKAHAVRRGVAAMAGKASVTASSTMAGNASVTASSTMAGTTCTACTPASSPSTSSSVGPSQIRNGNAHCETKREHP
jgi:hypothetical protein